MDNKIVGVMIAVMIGIITIGGVMVPVINDAVATTDTFTNDGLYYVDSVPDGESINYRFENGIIYVNDVAVISPEFESVYPDGVSIIFTEHIVLRYAAGSSTIGIRGQLNTNAYGLDITVSDGTITGTYANADGEDSTISWTYTDFFGIVPESDRVMAFAPMYVNADTNVFVTGLVALSGFSTYYIMNVSGSIDEGFTATLYTQGSGSLVEGVTVTSTIDYDVVDNHEDLYKLNAVNFTLERTSDGVEQTATATFTLMTVPQEIIAERSNPMDSAASGILTIAPLMVIISLLVMATALFVRSKY